MTTDLALVHLREAEAVIRAGLATFVEVGNALMRIRDERLYVEDYATFEAYCRGRWGFSDRRARQMIDAAEITATLPTGTMVPDTERQARELAGLDPETAAEVMEAAAESGPVTAAGIRDARAKVTGQQPTRPAEWTCDECGSAFKTEHTHCATCGDHYPAPEVCTAHHDIVNTETGEIVEPAPAPPRQPADKPGPLAVASDDLARLNDLTVRLTRDRDQIVAGIHDAPADHRAGWINDIARLSDYLTDLHRAVTERPSLRRIK